MAGTGQNWPKMAGNGWKRLDMAGNGQNWQEMDGNGWKWPDIWGLELIKIGDIDFKCLALV